MEQILDEITSMLQGEPALMAVRDWHKINGLVPGKTRSISVGIEELRYEEYTREFDECEADVKIYVSLDNRALTGAARKSEEHRLEYGDRVLREMVCAVRSVLTQDYTLRGSAEVSHIDKVEFVTAEDHTDLQIAVVSLSVKFYAERKQTRRRMTMLLEATEALTKLPITPVLDAEIEGLVKGEDYFVTADGIQWAKGTGAGPHLVTWQYDAASATVGRVRMEVDGEITEFGEED